MFLRILLQRVEFWICFDGFVNLLYGILAKGRNERVLLLPNGECSSREGY